MDHVAYTVPDLDQAIDFFTRHFGATLVFRDGPFEGPGMKERLNVDPAASCTLAMLRLGNTTNLELFEYHASVQAETGPRNSDIGGHHMGFYVDDIDAARSYLTTVDGVELLAGPNGVADDAPVAGQRWFYFLSPWGMQLEVTTDAGPGFYDGLPGAAMVPPGEVPRT